MKKIWITFLKLNEKYASWFLIIALGGLMWLGSHGHFDIAKTYLDTEQFTLTIGENKISLYMAIKSLIYIILAFWITAIISNFSDNRLRKMKHMRASSRVLVQKILQIIIYFLGFIITLNVIGIDLTSLTVLSGAMGIGLGFGLQKIASNFVSGLILLLERSLKPNDLVELEDGTFGFVRKSMSRATLIETIDGKEILVPNEDFITKQVINWTLSNPKARLTVSFGVSYGADIEKARDLALEAANNHPRTLKDPAAVCFLDNFGDSSVDFVMFIWIKDINDGFRNIKSEVMFDIWNKFKANDIEIPFPQRDLHLKTAAPIQLTPQAEEKTKAAKEAKK